MFYFKWSCPICGASNIGDAKCAETYTCFCFNCDTECEVDFEVKIFVGDVKAVNYN